MLGPAEWPLPEFVAARGGLIGGKIDKNKVQGEKIAGLKFSNFGWNSGGFRDSRNRKNYLVRAPKKNSISYRIFSY
jgi:hypothetical protein